MKTLFKNFTFLFSALLVAGVLLPTSSVAAQQTSQKNQTSKSLSVQGLAIDPFLIEADVNPGEKSQYAINLANTTNKPLSFTVSINDFVPNGRTGQPRFLDNQESGDPKFSLSSWISIVKQPNFVIPPNGQTTVQFTISPPLDAEPGTHYGGILFGQEVLPNQNGNTAVVNKAGAIILARLGKAQEQGTISDFFSQHRIYQKAPIDLLLSFHNYGNVHSKPKGDVTIRNLFGATVTQVPVNPDAGIVLPESERDFALSWSPRFAFGRYTAEAVLFYGNPKLEARTVTAFWVIPVIPLLYGLLGLAILLVLGNLALRRYNKYIINKHSS